MRILVSDTKVQMSSFEVLIGDCRETLKTLNDGSVQCCVTSPPYFGLRDYGHDGQIGLEPTPDEYIAKMVEVFREVRRVLADDGTLWLNIGDSYASAGKDRTEQQASAKSGLNGGLSSQCQSLKQQNKIVGDLKAKDLIGIPWMLAFALRADGWYLRQEIIWHKPNPMPESVTDRCTKSHESIFLLAKSGRYYFDAEAIAEPMAASSIERLAQPTLDQQQGSDRVPGKTNGAMKAVGGEFGLRNKRSVWTVTTKSFKGAHFATFPPDLIEPCILAGCPDGGTVLDPFGGSGTTAGVANSCGRNAILCEINPAYADMAKRRVVMIKASSSHLTQRAMCI